MNSIEFGLHRIPPETFVVAPLLAFYHFVEELVQLIVELRVAALKIFYPSRELRFCFIDVTQGGSFTQGHFLGLDSDEGMTRARAQPA